MRRKDRLTFVRKVITETENKFGGFARLVTICLNQPFRDLALVHKAWTDFQVGFARHHFDIPVLRDCILKMLLTLTGLKRPVLGVRPTIVPGKGNLLSLNKRS